MKIAMNAIFYYPKAGGIKEYIYNLLIHLDLIDKANEYIIYVAADWEEFAKETLPNRFKIKAIPYKTTSRIEIIKRSLFESQFWRKEERLERWDVFHSPFFHSPKLKATPVLLTVHDMRFFRYPRSYDRMRYIFLKNKVKKSVLRCSHIISISQFTKNELLEAYGIKKSKISVVYEAINFNKFSFNGIIPKDIPPLLFKKPFLLSVSHLEPRKNYLRLIKAFNLLKESGKHSDMQLVIVGQKKRTTEPEILKLIDVNPSIHYLNFVEHDTLIWLYKHAQLFLFPSYYEGFGFPPLEAATLGTVSAVSNVSSIPEICGDNAFYFNPFDIKDIAHVIDRALLNKEEYTAKKNSLNSILDSYSWDKNAKETLSLYSLIVNS